MKALVFLMLLSLNVKAGFFKKKEFKIPFFNRSLCDQTQKKFLETINLSQKAQKKGQKALVGCLKENKTKAAFFILEKLLTEEIKKPQKDLKKIQQFENQLAKLAFYELKNYEKAIKYYTKLLNKHLKTDKSFEIQFHISKSFFYLNKHSQALRELEKAFLKTSDLQQKQKALVLKGRILIAQKNFKQALNFFEDQIKHFPKQETLFREYKALIYESQKDFLLAIQELEKITPKKEFTIRKIKRLKERLSNQPGIL